MVDRVSSDGEYGQLVETCFPHLLCDPRQSFVSSHKILKLICILHVRFYTCEGIHMHKHLFRHSILLLKCKRYLLLKMS